MSLRLRVQIVLRKTDDVKRELKWKSDAAAAAAAAAAGSTSSAGSCSGVTSHQQSVVRSCISRLRRGSDFKTTTTSTRSTRPTAAAVPAKPPSFVEEDEERVPNETINKTVVVTTVPEGRGLQNDVTPMTSLKDGALASDDSDLDRRRQRVVAMLKTPDGQRMVQQMFVAHDDLKQELASLAVRLKRIDSQIGTMLQAAGSS